MAPINEPLPAPDAIAPDASETTDIATAWRKNGRRPTRRATPKPLPPARPAHYKVISVSIYTADFEQLVAKVAELKRRGKTKMTKSELIRLAVAELDLDKVAPR